ncbi:MAG: hypothetical protein A2161_18810 [Candidatus Schekmanbacteria bacterium RBG_13_48_7]|uniref:Uncharacterized protein n=1 Tax=Candidatus Schekmanbacteria bacterium RBG_13_48_7 TaxID=1817878 RepID=A0A1F7RSD0_9BACT|nr:MAG: hypothetical protein A2161_18810 [Candidatus Schekmanbacteria bacterium RBG_13_48_7]
MFILSGYIFPDMDVVPLGRDGGAVTPPYRSVMETTYHQGVVACSFSLYITSFYIFSTGLCPGHVP